jgi:methionyl-tRNA formyltransferase
MQEKIAIGETETAGELHDALKELGASLIVKTIAAIAEGNIEEKSQLTTDHSQLTIKHAPKLTTETCKIDWNKNAEDIYNLIRGLSPYPTAFTQLDEKIFKIYLAEKEIKPHQHAPGSVHSDGKSYLKFACKDGFINCTDIQMQGKKRMPVGDFLRGYRISQ